MVKHRLIANDRWIVYHAEHFLVDCPNEIIIIAFNKAFGLDIPLEQEFTDDCESLYAPYLEFERSHFSDSKDATLKGMIDDLWGLGPFLATMFNNANTR